jgi:ATP synthase protein I
MNTGWAVVGYLLAGIAVWGFLGWLLDRWLHLHGAGVGAGVVLGAAGAIYLIVRRFG